MDRAHLVNQRTYKMNIIYELKELLAIIGIGTIGVIIILVANGWFSRQIPYNPETERPYKRPKYTTWAGREITRQLVNESKWRQIDDIESKYINGG